MIRIMSRCFFFVLFLLLGTGLWLHSVSAATCSISANTTIDAAYVASSTCTVIALSGTPTITWSGTIDTGGPIAVNVNSGTVVFSGALVLSDAGSSVTVANGATVTHAAEDKTGVQITAPTVTVTGAINVNSKGCGISKGVNGAGDCATGNPGAAGNNYSGAAYGGVGGSGNFTPVNTGTYGSSTNPTLLGSGGKMASSNGGGRVGLVVSGTLIVDGSITANGASGGGSGGSVYINAGTFNGTGTVNSNGGIANGACNGGYGGGGGGRVAMYYGSGAFGFTNSSKITVSYGTGGCSDAKNGTTFILDRQTDDGAGTLTFNGGGLFAAGIDYVRDTINIISGSHFTCDTALTSLTVSSTSPLVWPSSTWVCAPTAATSLSIGSNSTISLTSLTATFTGTMGAVKVEGTSLTTSGMAWSLSGASSLALNVASFSNGTASTLTMSKVGSYTTFNTTGALTLNNFTYTGGTAGTASGETAGHLIFPRNIDLTLTNGKIFASVSSTLASVSIDSTSQISANANGCSGAFGPNSSNTCTSATAGYTPTYGGAGHGGTGGTAEFAAGGATYGSSTYPVLFGSGVGNGAGAGGGRVWLRVTGSLTNNGLITANAGTLGGSGGSIYLNAAAFAGTGNVSSTGAAGNGNVGCGAGGRIAMIASSFTFSGTSSTIAGATGCRGAGGVGTIYKLVSNSAPSLPSSLGPTALVNGSTTGTGTPTASFTLSDPDVADTVKYQIQIDDSADFGSPVVDYTSALAAQGSQAFQVGQATGTGAYAVGLAGQVLTSGSYYWRVRAIDASAIASSYSTANSGSVAFIVDTVVRSVQFSTASSSGLESVASGSIALSLSQTNFENVTVSYAVTAGSADGSGVDFTLVSGTATIVVGQTSTTIPFTVVNDSIDEPDETFTVTLSAPVNAGLGATTDFIYTITDDDTAAVELSTSTLRVTEGGVTDAYTLVLTSQPTSTVQVTLSAGDQILLSTSTIAFTNANWNTPVTVTVTAVNDSIAEPSQTVSITQTVSSTAYGYAGFTLSNVTVTLTDDDTAAVQLSKTSANTTEGGATDAYTVQLATQPTSTVQVLLSADDQVTISSSTLTFDTTNWNSPIEVTITAIDDQVSESSHIGTITQTVSSTAYGYSALSLSPISVLITDNDGAGINLSEGALAVTEGGADDTYTIVLATQPTSTVEVALLAGDQISLSTSTIVFTADTWNVPVTVTTTAVNDSIGESTQIVLITQTVSSTAYGYAGLSLPAIDVTITDDDVADVTFSKSTAAVTEGAATDAYTVQLATQPTSTVTILLSAGDQIVLSTSTVVFTASNWNVPVEVTITAVDDAVAESVQEVQITQTVSSTAFGFSGLTLSAIDVTVTDNDTAGVSFSGTGSLSATEGSVTTTFSLVLTSQPTSTVSVAFATTTNGVTLSTSTIVFTGGNWNVSVPVLVTATDDIVAEGLHIGTITPTVSSSAYGYTALSPSAIDVTLTDNDSPGVSLSKTSFTLVEGGANDEYTIVLTTAPTTTVEISLTSSHPRLGLSTTTLVFTTTTWDIPQTVVLTAINDVLFQPVQAVTVSHVASSTGIGYSASLVINSLEGTISDTDNTGGGAISGGGGGGGSGVLPIANVIPIPAPTISPAPIAPVIIVEPSVDAPPVPVIPPPLVRPGQEVVKVLNPTNILSLVEATNGKRDFASEAKYGRLILQDAKQFKVSITDEQLLILANFVTYGISEKTRALGSGERRALIRDAFETMKTSSISPTDLELLARGFKATYRNKAAEVAQLPRVRQTFLTIYGHLPNFKLYEEDLAWNTLMYRIRFPRDLKKEQQGILLFRKLFNKAPTEPFQWAVVRVLGYVKQ